MHGVAQSGGTLKLHRRGGRLHPFAQLLQHLGAFAAQKGAGLQNRRAVGFRRNLIDTGGGAEPHDIVDAVLMGLGIGDAWTALAQAEMLFDEIERGARGGGGGKGPEILRALVALDTAEPQARKGLTEVGPQQQEALVVAKADVVARAVLLDQAALGQGGLGLGTDDHEVDILHAAHQSTQLG